MTDLIWIGNTLYPRWLVFAVAVMTAVVFSYAFAAVVGCIVVALRAFAMWIWRLTEIPDLLKRYPFDRDDYEEK